METSKFKVGDIIYDPCSRHDILRIDSIMGDQVMITSLTGKIYFNNRFAIGSMVYEESFVLTKMERYMLFGAIGMTDE